MHLHHVTLQSGHVRESPREEVRGSVIRELAPLLGRIVAGDEVAVPWVDDPPCTMTGAAAGDAAIVTVWGPPDGEDPVPLATIGVASGPAEADRLWAMLHVPYTAMLGELVTPADQPPPTPWCAARLEVGLALHPEAALFLGDLERCIAWTWIERGEPRPGRLTRPRESSRPTRARPAGQVRRAPKRRR
jgi:hypothetical protein